MNFLLQDRDVRRKANFYERRDVYDCADRRRKQQKRKEKHYDIVVHDKSSLAPEGKSLAFQLGDGEGFRWLDGYDEISAEELLSGFSSQPETKTAQAEELIRSMLEDGAELHCEEIIRAAAERRISRRTVNEAKKNISGIVTRKAGARWLWSMEKEDCNIAEVSLKEG